MFKYAYAPLVACITKYVSTNRLASAEDIVQDTFVKAFEHWKLNGIPENPQAWLFTVARNKAIDVQRKNNVAIKNKKDLLQEGYNLLPDFDVTIDKQWNEEFEDEQLTLFFICCNPAIMEESQIAIVLKIFCGFSTKEIAHAFCTQEETIRKRIFRAQKTLEELNPTFVLPSSNELKNRLPVVHHILYLIFTEGYHSGKADFPIRDTLVEDAMRLCWQLCHSKKIVSGDTYALLALFCFHAARLYGRLNNVGLLVDFKFQDKTKWNYPLIEQGKVFLKRAVELDATSSYLAEAAIACEYCIAEGYKSVNWHNILKWYDRLLSSYYTPTYQIQKIIVLAELNGPAFALEALTKLEHDKNISNQLIFFLAKASWFSELNEPENALLQYTLALQHTKLPVEIRYIENKIEEIKKGKSG
ncbi:MAG: RNA polymerase sigma factor [Chryseotalea sp.]